MNPEYSRIVVLSPRILLPAFLVVALAVSAAAQEQAPGDAFTLAGHASKGRFLTYLNEDPLAVTEYTWEAGGAYEGKRTLTMAGQSVESTLRVEVDENGVWTRMVKKDPMGESTLARKGDRAVGKRFDGKELDLPLARGHVLYADEHPVLMELLPAAYDEKEGGEQQIRVLIAGITKIGATLTRRDPVERVHGGRDVLFSRYDFGLGGVKIELWFDPDGRLCLASVPQQKARFVREGYETMAPSTDVDPLLSKPVHAIVEQRGVMVAMRDGVKLATDIYRPETEGKHPCILIRTPYKKEMQEIDGRFYARRGYVVAIQDVRGRFASEGEWDPFVNEAEDGHDAIEWLAARPWSTGRVGMIGASYLGCAQWLAARELPPHLTTMIPNVSPPDMFLNIPYEYGAFFLFGAIWWAEVVSREATADLSGAAMMSIQDRDYREILDSLPVVDLDMKLFGEKNAAWRRWISHPTDDAYMRRGGFLDGLAELDIPVFHQSGWFDGDGIGSKLNYLKMAEHGHAYQKLVLGPWGHTDKATRRAGTFDFGEEALMDLPTAYLRWFDRWLKGIENGIDEEPLVSLFVCGRNAWLHGDTYPLEKTRMEKWYLSSDGGANTSKGDGVLGRALPAAGSEADTYTYDPGDPTPVPSMPAKDDETDPAILHKRVLEKRSDILVYTSEPLAEAMTICGPISSVIHASSSARDTDWFCSLSIVDAAGNTRHLVTGKLRARFRESLSEPRLLEPGKVYEYHLDMWQTGIEISKGSRLRVEIASAFFPMFSRNLNTGGHNEVETEHVPAVQVIHHDAARPSHVLLPIIPAKKD